MIIKTISLRIEAYERLRRARKNPRESFSDVVLRGYGRAYRYLKRNGFLIGANDLWSAAIAMRNGLELVTRNDRHFARVPGLKVTGYRQNAA